MECWLATSGTGTMPLLGSGAAFEGASEGAAGAVGAGAVGVAGAGAAGGGRGRRE